MLRLCVLGLACLWAGMSVAHATETRYVTDKLEATVRAGQGTDYQILRIISSGTPVKVLEPAQNGYVRVELHDGKTGWMLSRYLSETPIAQIRLADAEKQLAQLAEDNGRLNEEKQVLAQAKLQADQALSHFEEEQTKLKDELSELSKLAARPQEVESENRELQQRISAFEAEAHQLRKENERLQTGEGQAWFLAGAGVLLGGFLLGIIVPRIRWRKKASWDTF
ncbi:MAG: TIGR04211 family SH3 domain-containing protein [Gammaproteobacteria bacterium]|jgi:SH3 domain protein